MSEAATCFKSEADISECGQFRWSLERRWSMRERLLVGMQNPSTGGAQTNDPTISRLMRWAHGWGYGGIYVLNLLPIRTPSPEIALAWYRRHGKLEHDVLDSPEVERNHAQLYDLAWPIRSTEEINDALVAWGNVPADYNNLVQGTVDALNDMAINIYCLGTTAAGHPIHPMARGKHRVPDNATLKPFSLRGDQ